MNMKISGNVGNGQRTDKEILVVLDYRETCYFKDQSQLFFSLGNCFVHNVILNF